MSRFDEYVTFVLITLIVGAVARRAQSMVARLPSTAHTFYASEFIFWLSERQAEG